MNLFNLNLKLVDGDLTFRASAEFSSSEITSFVSFAFTKAVPEIRNTISELVSDVSLCSCMFRLNVRFT